MAQRWVRTYNSKPKRSAATLIHERPYMIIYIYDYIYIYILYIWLYIYMIIYILYIYMIIYIIYIYDYILYIYDYIYIYEYICIYISLYIDDTRGFIRVHCRPPQWSTPFDTCAASRGRSRNQVVCAGVSPCLPGGGCFMGFVSKGGNPFHPTIRDQPLGENYRFGPIRIPPISFFLCWVEHVELSICVGETWWNRETPGSDRFCWLSPTGTRCPTCCTSEAFEQTFLATHNELSTNTFPQVVTREVLRSTDYYCYIMFYIKITSAIWNWTSWPTVSTVSQPASATLQSLW